MPSASNCTHTRTPFPTSAEICITWSYKMDSPNLYSLSTNSFFLVSAWTSNGVMGALYLGRVCLLWHHTITFHASLKINSC